MVAATVVMKSTELIDGVLRHVQRACCKLERAVTPSLIRHCGHFKLQGPGFVRELLQWHHSRLDTHTTQPHVCLSYAAFTCQYSLSLMFPQEYQAWHEQLHRQRPRSILLPQSDVRDTITMSLA